MITIKSGSIDKLKADMLAMKKEAAFQKAKILKKYSPAEKRNGLISEEDRNSIKKYNQLQSICLIRSYLPVQVDGMLVNYLILSQFKKKMKKCTIQKIRHNHDGIVRIEYKTHSGKGALELNPLPIEFNNLYSIPTGEWTY